MLEAYSFFSEMAKFSRNRIGWTEKLENIFRDLKELWLDTQNVLQLANPRYGLLARYNNLENSINNKTKAKLKSMSIKIFVDPNKTEEAKLYISTEDKDYDKIEVEAGIKMIREMKFVFTIQNLEKFVYKILETCSETTSCMYSEESNEIFWQHAFVRNILLG